MDNKERDDKRIMLDNEEVTPSEFNEKASSLKKNERLVETSDGNYHIITRMYD